jgi:hypothetical protein
MIGGWINGTNAIYENAAIATDGRILGASLVAVYIDVGPSELPMIPIEAASLSEKLSNPGIYGLKKPLNHSDTPNATNIPS